MYTGLQEAASRALTKHRRPHPGDSTLGAAGLLVGTLEQDRISGGMGRGHHLLSASVCVRVPAVQETPV